MCATRTTHTTQQREFVKFITRSETAAGHTQQPQRTSSAACVRASHANKTLRNKPTLSRASLRKTPLAVAREVLQRQDVYDVPSVHRELNLSLRCKVVGHSGCGQHLCRGTRVRTVYQLVLGAGPPT
jgi:hypothetical protein